LQRAVNGAASHVVPNCIEIVPTCNAINRRVLTPSRVPGTRAASYPASAHADRLMNAIQADYNANLQPLQPT
jgi:hypothetical protein